MKVSIKDKNAINMQQSMHPLDYFSLAGQYGNPAFFPTEFNGSPVSYYQGSLGAQAVSGKLPGLPGGNSAPAPAQPSNSFEWSFPQYSQSWAFTPPGKQTYNGPPAFDPKSSTGTALPKPSVTAPKPTTKSASPFSLDALMAKYR